MILDRLDVSWVEAASDKPFLNMNTPRDAAESVYVRAQVTRNRKLVFLFRCGMTKSSMKSTDLSPTVLTPSAKPVIPWLLAHGVSILVQSSIEPDMA